MREDNAVLGHTQEEIDKKETVVNIFSKFSLIPLGQLPNISFGKMLQESDTSVEESEGLEKPSSSAAQGSPTLTFQVMGYRPKEHQEHLFLCLTSVTWSFSSC